MIREILAFTTYLPLVINVASNPPYLHPIKFYLPTACATSAEGRGKFIHLQNIYMLVLLVLNAAALVRSWKK